VLRVQDGQLLSIENFEAICYEFTFDPLPRMLTIAAVASKQNARVTQPSDFHNQAFPFKTKDKILKVRSYFTSFHAKIGTHNTLTGTELRKE
jgi:hypothetical protein